MPSQFAPVLIFLLVGMGFVLVSLAVGKRVRPHTPQPEKLKPYECGEIPLKGGWINFNIRFYILALLFVIFDVEIAFMFPVGVVFRRWVREGAGVTALAEIGLFVVILLLGLVYAWRKRDLEWVKRVPDERPRGGDVIRRASQIP